jgi:hypothetical protein
MIPGNIPKGLLRRPVGRHFHFRAAQLVFTSLNFRASPKRTLSRKNVAAGEAPSLSKLGFRERAERPVTLSWVRDKNQLKGQEIPP